MAETSDAYKAVFSPVQVGSLTLKNRVLLAPMEGTGMIDWMLGCKSEVEKVHDFYVERAKDGVGLVIPGMLPVRSVVGNKWLYKHPKVFGEVTPLIEELHSYGTRVFFQLGTFAGRNFTLPTVAAKLLDGKILKTLAKPLMNLDDNMVSPDDGLPNVFMPEYKTRALTTAEVEEYVQAYAQAAKLCKDAGVDGVEVHAVHEGYLMDQFTLPYCNHRTDKYGGSFENRYRFACEVIRAIKDLCGEDYPVSLRYSVTSKTIDFNVGAVPGEKYDEVGRAMEESERAIKLLEDAGVDLFDCDNGTYDAWFWAHPPVYMPLNCNLDDVAHIKAFTSKPVFCAGRMQLDAAEEAIDAGHIDGVAIGRQFLADERFLTKAREGRLEDVRPCISCHSGCLPVATWKGVGVEMNPDKQAAGRMCALNSLTFCEKRFAPVPAATPRRIAVVGGGIGGMEFALEAAKRGHTVDLYERGDVLGGVFVAAAALSFKEKDRELLDWYRRQIAESAVSVHMGHEVTSLDELDADEIVVATGSRGPRRLDAPGAERCVDATSFLLDEAEVGESVVIVGGGLTGCEVAYELALQGKRVAIVEVAEDLVKAPGVCYANSSMLRELMRYHKVPVYLESTVTEVRDQSVVVHTKIGDDVVVPADTVITSIGYLSGSGFETEGREHVHVIGDAAKVGNLKSVIWAADDLAVDLSQ